MLRGANDATAVSVSRHAVIEQKQLIETKLPGVDLSPRLVCPVYQSLLVLVRRARRGLVRGIPRAVLVHGAGAHPIVEAEKRYWVRPGILR